MENTRIADYFTRIADILDIRGENPFRIRSYRNAARTVEDMSENVAHLVESGADLEAIPGIGKSIAEKIKEIVTTGRLKFLDDLESKLPPGLTELLKIKGIGPKKVKLFYEDLKIDSIDRMEKAARAGKLSTLFRMGRKAEENIIRAIEHYRAGSGRFKLSVGFTYAEALTGYLKKIKGVEQLEPAGSLRRRRETIGDLDILAICGNGSALMDRLVAYDDVEEVLAHGHTKSSVRLSCGLQVDVRVLEKKSFGAALQYFTGSKAHNIALRKRAVERGLKISEYGVFKQKKAIGGAREEEVYKAVGLPWIPPELRENRGEIEAAEKGKLPKLIELADIRGDLQMHTKATDGKDTILEMAKMGKKLGYSYIAVTEHSRAVRVAGGLDERELAKHLKKIEKANSEVRGITILKGVEVDILGDGSLDLGDDVLKECDVVMASVHSRFTMPEKEMTKRITKALKNKHVNMLAHPTGRLLLEREPYKVNLEDVLEAAKDNGVIVEINAHPDRLDLNDVHARMAKEMGVLLAINTDAHAAMQLGLMRYGVFTARRGWLEAKNVVNTYPLKKLLNILGVRSQHYT